MTYTVSSGTLNSSIPYHTINQVLSQIIHILHFYLVDLLLKYAPDVVNWIEIIAVWRPQVYRDECMVVGFIQLLHMASLQTFQTKVTIYDNHYNRGLGDTCLSRYLMYGWPSRLCVSSSIAATLS